MHGNLYSASPKSRHDGKNNVPPKGLFYPRMQSYDGCEWAENSDK